MPPKTKRASKGDIVPALTGFQRKMMPVFTTPRPITAGLQAS